MADEPEHGERDEDQEGTRGAAVEGRRSPLDDLREVGLPGEELHREEQQLRPVGVEHPTDDGADHRPAQGGELPGRVLPVEATPDGEHMTMDTFRKAIAFIKANTIPFMMVSGGEPMENRSAKPTQIN